MRQCKICPPFPRMFSLSYPSVHSLGCGSMQGTGTMSSGVLERATGEIVLQTAPSFKFDVGWGFLDYVVNSQSVKVIKTECRRGCLHFFLLQCYTTAISKV